ncbi:MAG: CotH kinase family protein [Verrucomicrobiales bacterium]|nr:CotH kinase family protein [Verrucomicrobiales bacterium]
MKTLPLLLLLVAGTAGAALTEYDAAITADATTPASKLTNAVTFTGTNSAAFDFGTITGDATFEFIVQGTPSTASGYLAVGANTVSNLRFEQWNNTAQLGMTQIGVADYLFTPPVPTPESLRHITYVWNGADTVRLYVDGVLAGTNSSVSPAFGMPSGVGRLGANASNGEGMVGTVYRVTCYDSVLPDAKILAHADAYHDVLRPPTIGTFTASPPAVTAGGQVQLTWTTDGVTVTLNGSDVTGQSQASFTQSVTTTYTLAATNAHGTTTRALTVPVIQAAGHVVINEFMAENKSTLADEDGEYSDWLELHNPTASPVNLGGLHLTDNAAQPQKWALPAVSLAAGEFKTVFLSSKNRAPLAGELHANFRLSKGGEYLALTNGTTALQAFAPAFPPQDEDMSFGLAGADPALSGFMTPTPGAANDPAPPLPARVAFSHPSGILDAPFSLSLTCATAGAAIYYRLNNTTTATLYTAPLSITSSTKVTAWSERYGQRSADARASWMKPGPTLAGYTSNLPIMVIDNFASGPIPQKGWSGNGAGIAQVPRQAAAWAVWERQGATATLSGPPQMASQIGIRGRGAFSSSWRQKPYAVEAWNETGGEKAASVLNMPEHSDWVLYFPDPDNNKDPSLLFNTFLYQLARECGHDAPRFRWVELFVNEDGGDLALADRRGVYVVLEKVSRGSGRLDFEKLSADGSSGGWITNINRMDAAPETGWPAENGATTPQFFRTAGPNRIQQTTPNNPTVVGDDLPQQSNGFLNFDNPGGYKINPAQRAAIEDWFRRFEDVLYNNTLWRDPVNGYRRWLDERDFAEYFVFNEITRNGDGMLISMFPWKGDDGKLRMGPVWDYNWASYQVGGGATGNLRWRSNQIWYARLFTDPDFMQLYIDRWFAFRRGPMSNAGMNAIIDAQSAEISAAKAMLNGVASAADFTARLSAMKTWLTQRGDWVDSQYTSPPVLTPAGGIIVPTGQTVTLTAPAGTIYRTLNGTDPRPPGGVLPVPTPPVGNSIQITADAKVFARAHVSGTVWSAQTVGVYVTDAVAADATNLVVSEIHYHPTPPTAAEMAAGFANADDFEFVEITNTSAQKVSLAGVQFTRGDTGEGIAFAFNDGDIWSLAPGTRAVVVKNRAAFALRYGTMPVAGEFTGRLDNQGDLVTLKASDGAGIAAIRYADACPWPAAADGTGYSLTFVGGAPDEPANWRTSLPPGGTPGSGDRVPFTGGSPLDYALGGHRLTWQRSGASLIIEQPRVPGTDDAVVALEISTDLQSWSSASVACQEEVRPQDGSVLIRWTTADAPRLFLRARATLR